MLMLVQQSAGRIKVLHGCMDVGPHGRMPEMLHFACGMTKVLHVHKVTHGQGDACHMSDVLHRCMVEGQHV